MRSSRSQSGRLEYLRQIGKQINQNALLVFLLLNATIFDSLRDALLGQAGWWPWHLIKWMAFFPPLIYLWWKWEEKPFYKAMFAFSMLWVWRAVYQTVQ